MNIFWFIFTWCVVVLMLILSLCAIFCCDDCRPSDSKSDTQQIRRQESTAAVEHQVFPAEAHPVASQLRVNLPDDDDDFNSASAVAIENQNAVDLPPSYQECCPTIPMSSLDKRDTQQEEENPPTSVDFVKGNLHQRIAEKRVTKKRLETDL